MHSMDAVHVLDRKRVLVVPITLTLSLSPSLLILARSDCCGEKSEERTRTTKSEQGWSGWFLFSWSLTYASMEVSSFWLIRTRKTTAESDHVIDNDCLSILTLFLLFYHAVAALTMVMANNNIHKKKQLTYSSTHLLSPTHPPRIASSILKISSFFNVFYTDWPHGCKHVSIDMEPGYLPSTWHSSLGGGWHQR